jgi:hypothetical protein
MLAVVAPGSSVAGLEDSVVSSPLPSRLIQLINAVRTGRHHFADRIALEALAELDAMLVELARLRRLERAAPRHQGMTELS